MKHRFVHSLLVIGALALAIFGQGGGGETKKDGKTVPAKSRRESPKRPTTKPPSKTVKSVVTNNYGMEMVWIPPDSFVMGSEKGEPDEKPMHQVTISNGFYMGRYEVTQAQWRSAMGNNSPSVFEGDYRPVDNIAWYKVQEFVRRLNQAKDGYSYRLPTEAEWEYACRAGTTGDYAGSLNSMAWVETGLSDYYKPHPVGAKQPNAFGLFDTHGNVWEWCSDWYDETYYSRSPKNDPQGPVSGQYRVLRGGSWAGSGYHSRSARRVGPSPALRGSLSLGGSVGFRLVATRS